MKDWRGSLRRMVNLNDDLSLWRRVVIRMVDAAESYMRRMEPRTKPNQTRGQAGWIDYGRSSSLESPRLTSNDSRRQLSHQLARLRRDFGPYFDTKARAVMEGRPVQLRTTGGTITARLVRFRHSDSVFEWDTASTKRGRTGTGVCVSTSAAWILMARSSSGLL
jgi:hypothetical protein